MRGRPLGTLVSSVSLGVIAVGAVALALILVATSRNVASTGLMGPFGIALLAISFGFAAVFAAIALWNLEAWAWPLGLAVALVGLLSSIVALVSSRQLLLILGIALCAAAIVSLLPRSVRATYRS
ncbi:MAG: hypothetical protein FJ038_03505 [Chloroflexi bacterium]|nr:hypothetical protein [Chloroflexota bacterium]